VGVELRLPDGRLLCISDSTGAFKLDITSHGFTQLCFRTLGYREELLSLEGTPDTMMQVSMQRSPYTLPEVLILSSRVPQSGRFSPSPATVITREEINVQSATSLANVISEESGIFIKDYGATSALKTLSQQGMGTEHTLILLNGMRLSSFQNGLVDLGLLSVDQIEAVEVVRGGQSASYGADAVAGLVNVITRPAVRSGFNVSSSVGSFGYGRYLLSGSLGNRERGIRASYGEERTDDDFGFEFRTGPETFHLTRRNSDMLARYGTLQGSMDIGQAEVGMFVSTYSSERGVPGSVVSISSSGTARQHDNDQNGQISFSSSVASDMTLHIDGQLHIMHERYWDPMLSIGGTSLDNYFRNVDARVEPRLDMNVSEKIHFSIGGEIARTTGEGNSLAVDVQRRQAAAFAVAEVGVMPDGQPISSVTFFPAIRADAVSAFNTTWSPQVGFVADFASFTFGPLKSVNPVLRSSVGRNFRVPTFNELYFSGGGGIGNPALKPERSTSVELGGGVTFEAAGRHELQASLFNHDMTDRIIWVPGGSSTVTPKNLRRVRSHGSELSYRWDLPNGVFCFEANYTYSSSRKISEDFPGDPAFNAQLIYVPLEKFSLSWRTTIHLEGPLVKEVGGLVSYAFVGQRFYTEDNTGSLPSHQLVNVSARSRFIVDRLGITAKVEINNLFDEDYQVILGYPMPGRSFRLTMGIEY
jgi:outer membrane cobalamin receptor